MGTNRVRRNYTEDFKKDAVALVTTQGYSATDAAKSLGINPNLIYKWRKDFEEQESGGTLSLDEREELKKLRQEIHMLKMEKEILKKASAYFAKEMK